MSGGSGEWLPRGMIASVFIETAIAFVLTYAAGIGPTVEPDMGAILVILLLAVGISGATMMRFGTLSNMAVAQQGGQRANAVTLASAFAQAPASYGLAAAISTGRGAIALPFAALSLLSFFVLLSYVDEVFPRNHP